MIRKLSFCLALATSFSVTAQTETTDEKTPEFPVPAVVDSISQTYISRTIDSSLWLDLGAGFCPVPWPDPVPWIYPKWTFTYIKGYLCTDRFYDNGNLQSRCACDADSVLHGKAVFWEENGRISSVEYYSKGKVYTKKFYDEGRVTELCNYAYRNGEQLLHGEHIEYFSDGKTIGRYSFGNKIGPHTTYINGKRTETTTYKNGITIREEKFESDGTLYSLAVFDEEGRPIGEAYSYNRKNDIRYITSYENGKRAHYKQFQAGILVVHEEFNSNSELVSRSDYFPNGAPHTLLKFDSNQSKLSKEWSQDGTLITDYLLVNRKLIGKGFYTAQNTITRFEQKFNSNGSDYLECWIIVSGDTTAFYYARNEGNFFHDIIVKNNFVQHNGRAVKTGKWTTFENNKILSEINYSNGVKYGKADYYDTTTSEKSPYLTGQFNNNLRSGPWTLRNDTLLIQTNYHYGNLHGDHYVYSRIAGATPKLDSLTPVITCKYNNGILVHHFVSYSENGNRKIEGFFENGVLTSYWREYDHDGQLSKYGPMENGVPTGKWYRHFQKKNGKWKQKREKEIIVIPEITVPTIESIRPDFLELTGSNIAS